MKNGLFDPKNLFFIIMNQKNSLKIFQNKNENFQFLLKIAVKKLLKLKTLNY